MKYYGIFDTLDNYRLLRYSTADTGSQEFFDLIPGSRTETKKVVTICLPDIEYSPEYVGKQYNPKTKTFSDD